MDMLIRSCSSGIPAAVAEAARAEGMDAERMARRIAAGRIVIPNNPVRSHRTCAIGQGCTVKVNVNVGTSGTRCDYALEEKKARAALGNGADAIMDLSTGGDLVAIRKKMLALDTTVGTVPVRGGAPGRKCGRRGC